MLIGTRPLTMHRFDEKPGTSRDATTAKGRGAPAAKGMVVIGPDGSPLTRDDLPPTDTKRWVIRRKAEVVAGVRAGLISLSEACERYALSLDEFLLWQRQFDSHGLEGLKVTRLADYRRPARPARSAHKAAGQSADASSAAE